MTLSDMSVTERSLSLIRIVSIKDSAALSLVQCDSPVSVYNANESDVRSFQSQTIFPHFWKMKITSLVIVTALVVLSSSSGEKLWNCSKTSRSWHWSSTPSSQRPQVLAMLIRCSEGSFLWGSFWLRKHHGGSKFSSCWMNLIQWSQLFLSIKNLKWAYVDCVLPPMARYPTQNESQSSQPVCKKTIQLS